MQGQSGSEFLVGNRKNCDVVLLGMEDIEHGRTKEVRFSVRDKNMVILTFAVAGLWRDDYYRWRLLTWPQDTQDDLNDELEREDAAMASCRLAFWLGAILVNHPGAIITRMH